MIIPVGATEQHSYHLPLGVDTIIARNISAMLAEIINGVVAPAIPYGYKSNPTSGGGPLFPGTVDLNGSTLVSLIIDLLNEFIADGWKKIIIMNSHYENQAFLAEAADLALKQMNNTDCKILLISWWDNISGHIMPDTFDEYEFAGWDLEHAAITETSLMMYFAPELVDKENLPHEGLKSVNPYQAFPVTEDIIPPSGSLYTARSSSREKGKLIAEDVTNNFLAIVKKEFV